MFTSVGTLAKRHVFHYFDEKSTIFADPDILVGGGYTNDVLEGVEKFWVAWGILGRAFELASQHPDEAPPVLPTDADITRFRPWDQPETLEHHRGRARSSRRSPTSHAAVAHVGGCVSREVRQPG